MTNPSDIGTKSLSEKRVRLLLYLINYNNLDGDLGLKEFEEEKAKKEKRDQLRSIRAVIHHEVIEAGEQQSSTLMNKIAKKLMRLTLAALLADVGEGSLEPDWLIGWKGMAEDGRTYETKLFYGGNGLPHDLCNHVTDPAGDLYLFFKIKKYWQLNEYHRGMIQQVREILKEEAKRRERARRRRARGTPREARIAKFQ